MVIAEQLRTFHSAARGDGTERLALVHVQLHVLIVGENVVLPPDVSLLLSVAGFCAVMLLTYLTAAILDWKKIYVKL